MDRNIRTIKISIVTATYNSANTIKDTIESVLKQDYHNIEHIIVDGVSKDDTLAIVQSYGDKIAKVISEPDKGIYDAMNKGIKMATGDVIGILNSDDFFATDNVISLIVSGFENNPELDGVYSNLFYVEQDNPSKIVRHWVSKPFKQKSFFHGWHPPHPTLYLKKEVYEKYGYFDLNFPLAADFELMLRFFEKYKIKTKYIDYTTIRMRLGGATSKNWENVRKQNVECLEAFRVNGFKAPFLYPVYRLFPKLLQYFKK